MTIKRSPITLPNRKTLAVDPVNGHCLHIDTSSVAFLDVERDKEDYVTSVSIEGEHTIKVGDTFEVNIGAINSQYEVKFMAVQEGDKSVVLFTSFPTRTKTFLLPLLNKTKTQLRYDTYFVNAYIDEEGEHISLKYRFTGTPLYKEWEQLMMTDPLFISHKDYDPYHVMYTFRIPKEFHADVQAFMEGKYSLFSNPLKQRIKKFYGDTDEAATMKIVQKDEGLKKSMEAHLGVELPDDAELASIPDLKTEIYNI
jgi:hypothetical protein